MSLLNKINKKYIVFTAIIIAEFIILSLFSEILNISTENTMLGVFGIDVIFATICVMLFHIAVSKKGSFVSYVLYFGAGLLAFCTFIGTVAFFTGV